MIYPNTICACYNIDYEEDLDQQHVVEPSADRGAPGVARAVGDAPVLLVGRSQRWRTRSNAVDCRRWGGALRRGFRSGSGAHVYGIPDRRAGGAGAAVGALCAALRPLDAARAI